MRKTERNQGHLSQLNLEEQYMSLLHDKGLKHTSYVTIFTDRLVENIDGLIKDTMHKKIIVYLQQDASKTMYNSCDSPDIFMSKLRDVAAQTRGTIVIQKNKFVRSFNKDSQADSVPIALMILMSMSKSINHSTSCYVQLQEKKRKKEDRQLSSCQISQNSIGNIPWFEIVLKNKIQNCYR